MEVETNFASTSKFKEKIEDDAIRRCREEASTSNQERESHEYRIEEMNKLIKNLSNKLVKLELEAKNSSPHPNQMIPNCGFNPQYRKPPLQLLQQERKEQQDHIQPPLYLEGEMEGQVKEVTYNQEDQFLVYSEDE